MCPFYVKDEQGNLIGPHPTREAAIGEAVGLLIDVETARMNLVQKRGAKQPPNAPRKKTPKKTTTKMKERTGDGSKSRS